MNILYWIIIGGVAGWLASIVMKTNSRQGLIMDIIVGIIGGFVGGFVLDFAGFDFGAGIFASLGTAFVGAVIFLAILKLIRR